jgi:YVTN family beta-propeller protein
VVDGSADTVMQTVTVGAASPQWVSLDGQHNRVFTAGGLVGDWPVPFGVTIIDGESLTPGRLLPGPYLPGAIGRWGSDENVFCAGWADAGVFVFDGMRGRPVGVLGDRPHIAGLLADSVTGNLYCMSDWPPQILVIDPATNRVRSSVPLTHSPGPVCFNTVDRKVYVAAEDYSGAPGVVTVVDGVGDTLLKEIDLGRAPWALAYNPDDDILYAAGFGPSYGIWVIDGKGDSVIVRVENDGHTHGLVYNAVQRKLYAYSLGGEVAVIDPSTNSEIKNIEAKMRAGNSVLNSSGTRLYLGSYSNDSVCVIDCVDNSVSCHIPVAGSASVLCYDVLDDLLFVGNSFRLDSGYLTVIDCAREKVVTVLPVETRQLLYDRQTNAVYDLSYQRVTAIDGQSRAILRTFATDFYPEYIASAPGWPFVYVCDDHLPEISVVHKAAGPVDLAVRAMPDAQATVVRGRLDWTGTLAVMYDKCGRRVADVHRGGNDVSRLRPGVYFVRQNGVRRGTYARKIVLTR